MNDKQDFHGFELFGFFLAFAEPASESSEESAVLLPSNGFGNPIEVGRWAHARRRFVDERDLKADRFVRLISRLYKVEKDARNLNDSQRHASCG